MPVFSQDDQVRIAMAQIFCLDGDRSGNFVRIENAVAEASKAEADIVCFPETSILGWVNPDAHQLASPIPGRDSDRLCKLAEKYNIFICIGLAEKDGENLFDAALLINNRGEIILKHRKINILDWLMTPPYSKGSELKAVNTQFGRIGIMICADSFKDELLQQMKNQDPDLVIIPYGWAKEETDWPEHGDALMKTVQQAARKMECPVIGTDLVGIISNGPWRGLVYGGQSVVSDKNGKILGRCKDRDKDLLIISLKL